MIENPEQKSYPDKAFKRVFRPYCIVISVIVLQRYFISTKETSIHFSQIRSEYKSVLTDYEKREKQLQNT